VDALDITLASLKFFGIGAAAVFAVIAVVYDFKDENQKVTRAGWIGISGVIVAALLSTGSHTAEVLKARQDANEASKKAANDLAESRRLLTSVSNVTKTSQELLLQVQRSLELINLSNLRFGFGLSFSIDDPAFVTYKTRLEAKCAELQKAHDSAGNPPMMKTDDKLKFYDLFRGKEGGLPGPFLTIQSGSTLWPNSDRPGEEIAAMIVSRCGMSVEFSNPNHPEPSYGLEVLMGGTLDGTPAPDQLQPIYAKLRYSLDQRTLSLDAYGAKDVTGGLTEPTDEFLSVRDFEEAKVTITLFTSNKYTKQVPSLSLRHFTVSCGDQRRSVTGCRNAQKVESEDGLTFSGTLSRD